MFDIGEPSEASDNLAAMLEFDLDVARGLVSQHSSSNAGAGSPILQDEGYSPKDQVAKEQNDSVMPLASRPPLLKMRTTVEAAKKRDLTKSTDGHNQLSSKGGQGVQSE